MTKKPYPPKPGRSVAELYPHLLDEYSPDNEYSLWEMGPGSKYKVEWVCMVCDNTYYARVQDKTKKNCSSRCPSCRVNKIRDKLSISPYYQSLEFLYPNLAKEWSDKNDRNPSEVYPNTHYKCIWVCKKHGDYVTSGNNRVQGSICPKCSLDVRSNKLSTPPKEKSLAFLYPDIASTWSSRNTCTSFEVYPQSNIPKRLWICEFCGEEYSMTCANRTRRGGHKKCRLQLAGNKRSTPPKSDSLATLYHHLLSEYSPSNSRDPYSLYPQANYLAKWVCSQGYEWEAWVYNRTGKNSGCPHCCNNQTSTAEDLLRQSLLPFGASLNPQTKLGKWNVDIYFPEKKTIVEYDGSHWHHKPENYERDKRKSLELLEMGYRVVRVRTYKNEHNLTSLGIDNKNYFEVFYEEPKKISDVDKLALQILSVL